VRGIDDEVAVAGRVEVVARVGVGQGQGHVRRIGRLPVECQEI
jgi:hypothetical protein